MLSQTDNPNPRHQLLKFMQKLEDTGKDCASCTGVCCSFVGNSVQLTPLEAFDLLSYLIKTDRWTENLQRKIDQTIEQYGLNREPAGNGQRTFSRKTYTCPLFKEQALGCPLPPHVKPFGCLAFNPLQSGIKDGESCRSEINLLKELETDEIANQNQAIREHFELNWHKKPLPLALIDLHEKMVAEQED